MAAVPLSSTVIRPCCRACPKEIAFFYQVGAGFATVSLITDGYYAEVFIGHCAVIIYI